MTLEARSPRTYLHSLRGELLSPLFRRHGAEAKVSLPDNGENNMITTKSNFTAYLSQTLFFFIYVNGIPALELADSCVSHELSNSMSR